MKINNSPIKSFKSCFLSDISIYEDKITLTDTSNRMYFISKSDQNALISFKQWFQNVYLKCIAQTLSIFMYEIIEDEPGVYNTYIKKFVNSDDTLIQKNV